VIREAEARLAKAERFLAQAAVLSPESMPEAIIHLSYYAMLHAAAAVLIERTGRAPKTHGAVIGQFSQLTKDLGEKAKSLSRAFNRAEDMRLAADYVASEIPGAADVAEVRDTARDFLAYCRSLL
jgi:uncharacterized protein (UPF0332 family)